MFEGLTCIKVYNMTYYKKTKLQHRRSDAIIRHQSRAEAPARPTQNLIRSGASGDFSQTSRGSDLTFLAWLPSLDIMPLGLPSSRFLWPTNVLIRRYPEQQTADHVLNGCTLYGVSNWKNDILGLEQASRGWLLDIIPLKTKMSEYPYYHVFIKEGHCKF